MEPSLVALDQSFSGAADDFPALLRRKGLLGPAPVFDRTAQVGTAIPESMAAD